MKNKEKSHEKKSNVINENKLIRERAEMDLKKNEDFFYVQNIRRMF